MKVIRIMLVMIVAGFLAVACSNKEESAKVADKIEKGETLTQGDYTTIIEYLGKYAEAAQPIQDKINNLPAEDPKVEPLQKELDALKSDNKYVAIFTETLGKASQSELGAENVALVDKFSGYEWFTSPDWAEESTLPGVGGIELESPASDTAGVVAGAVDEIKVKE